MQFVPFTAAILFGVIAVCLVFAPSAYRASNRIFAGLLGVLSVQMLGLTTRFQIEHLEAFKLNIVFAMCIGPLMYMYLQSLLMRPGRAPRYVHGIPVLAMIVLLLSRTGTYVFSDVFILASLTVYTGLSFRLVRQSSTAEKGSLKPEIANFSRFCVGFLTVLTCIDYAIFFELQISDDHQTSVVLLMNVFLLAVLSLYAIFVFLNRGEYIAWAFRKKYDTPSQDLTFTVEEHNEVLNKLNSLISKDQIYLHPETSLATLADAMSVPQRLVSAAINQAHGKSVRRFINDLRIEYATKQLRETQNPVLDVMYSAGFESKSNFYKEFHQVVGCSPNQYRKKKAS